ncbi:MAG: hypothetical protein C0404_01215 [Verrucomicrobia bacterium]|nr:hypothetical protein [Verrucomicrobiota bacterium]
MKHEQKRPEKVKRPYKKPVLRTIELSAEEVLSVGCKTLSGGFDAGATPCSLNNCSAMGS